MKTQKLFRDLAIGEQFRFPDTNAINDTSCHIPYTKLSPKKIGRYNDSLGEYFTRTLDHGGVKIEPTGTYAPIRRYEIIEYDVWGNERDGYFINQSFRTGRYVEFTEYEFYTDKLFWRKVKEALGIKRNVRHASLVDGYQNDDVVYVEHEPTGYPLGELRLITRRQYLPWGTAFSLLNGNM